MLMNEYCCLNWFDIDKYEEYVHSLNHEQWFLALQIRHEYWNLDSHNKCNIVNLEVNMFVFL